MPTNCSLRQESPKEMNKLQKSAHSHTGNLPGVRDTEVKLKKGSLYKNLSALVTHQNLCAIIETLVSHQKHCTLLYRW